MMPNSPYAISPLRMKFEEETTGTFIHHGKRDICITNHDSTACEWAVFSYRFQG